MLKRDILLMSNQLRFTSFLPMQSNESCFSSLSVPICPISLLITINNINGSDLYCPFYGTQSSNWTCYSFLSFIHAHLCQMALHSTTEHSFTYIRGNGGEMSCQGRNRDWDSVVDFFTCWIQYICGFLCVYQYISFCSLIYKSKV